MADAKILRDALAQLKSGQHRTARLERRAGNAEQEVRFLAVELARMKTRAEIAEARLASYATPNSAVRRGSALVEGGANGFRS